MSDLHRSLTFYRDLLGFRVLSKIDVKGEDVDKLLGLDNVVQRTVFVERDGVRLALFEFASPKPVGGKPRAMNELGMAAMMFRVDDLDATLKAMRQAGIKVMDDTRTDHADYGSRMVFVLDPDGTLVELIEIPGDPYQPFGE